MLSTAPRRPLSQQNFAFSWRIPFVLLLKINHTGQLHQFKSLSCSIDFFRQRDDLYSMFASREDAGRRLGHYLMEQDIRSDIVLGLPRGGVVVAAEVANILRVPLEVV